jgi:lysophospholipase L1-like esterase
MVARLSQDSEGLGQLPRPQWAFATRVLGAVRSRALRNFASACLGMALHACGGDSPGPGPTPPGPTVTCPAAQEISAPQGQTPAVNFQTPTAQGGEAPVAVTCQPASGSQFPAGTTTVTCTATDNRGRTGTCTFPITVTATVVPRLSAMRFLAFGDSLTSGTTSPDPVTLLVNEPDSYPFKLHVLLSARYTSQTVDVLNEGCAGEFVDDRSLHCAGGVSRLRDVLDQHRPQVLLLMHGANNLLAKEDAAIPEIIGALEDMIEDARRAGAIVMVATLPPQNINGSRGRGADEVPILNHEIAKMAQDEGAILVDLFTLLGGSPNGIIGADGLHPTKHGYDLIADIWFNAVKAQFEQSTPASLLRRSR